MMTLSYNELEVCVIKVGGLLKGCDLCVFDRVSVHIAIKGRKFVAIHHVSNVSLQEEVSLIVSHH